VKVIPILAYAGGTAPAIDRLAVALFLTDGLELPTWPVPVHAMPMV
jgi:hypothetical protein